MHTLFEAREVLDCIVRAEGRERSTTGELAAIRVAHALMILSGTSASSISAAYQWLQRAEDHQLLQVFFDYHGVTRGYATFALLDDETDARARDTPALLNHINFRPEGCHLWLLELLGGPGQKGAMMRHLCNNFLRPHSRMTYLRRNHEDLRPRTLNVRSRRRQHRWSGTGTPLAPDDFSYFRRVRDSITHFYDYARLLASTPAYDVEVRRAVENFTHVHALRQYEFDREYKPKSFVCWAMLDEDAMRRIESEGICGLRPGDWRSGSVPCVIEVLGDEKQAASMLNEWQQRLFPVMPLRLIHDSRENCLRFADAI